MSLFVLFGTYPGGTRIERHTHPTDNWGVITKGEMVIAMDGAETRYAGITYLRKSSTTASTHFRHFQTCTG